VQSHSEYEGNTAKTPEKECQRFTLEGAGGITVTVWDYKIWHRQWRAVLPRNK